MDENYPMYCDGQVVGSVAVRKTGMFFRFLCRGSGIAHQHCRLILYTDTARKDLGLWPFYDRAGEITAHLSAKQAGMPPYRFCIEPENKQQFVAVYADRPFSSLSQFEKARFTVCDGQPGIVFTD